MKARLLISAFALALPAAPLGANGINDPGECAPCHPAARVQWRGGVHAAEGMVCGRRKHYLWRLVGDRVKERIGSQIRTAIAVEC